jgi:glycosyltransferase involved in cell wall biosynthesis
MPRVSVVIPTYNRGELLRETIDSVLAQTYHDFEIIVVDDGSTDNTAQLLTRYQDDVRLVYRAHKNCGVAATRNHGIRLARGEFLAFLDSDDRWLPQKLERQLQFADAHPEYGLIATEISSFNKRGAVKAQNKTATYRIKNGHVVEHLLFGNWIQTSTVLARRECVQAVGGFDEEVGQFGEDWLTWMRIAARSAIYFMPEPLVEYRIHEESLTSHLPEAQYESLMKILAKLDALPQFQANPKLLRSARYRICLGRGYNDLSNGAYEPAISKLRTACTMKRMPVNAMRLILQAMVAKRLVARTAHPKRENI